MTEKRLFRLVHDNARRNAANTCMTAPDGFEVRFAPPSKTREQEKKYHAMIGDVANQWTFSGRKLEEIDMKRLLVDQFKRDTLNDPEFAGLWRSAHPIEMVPSIDGMGVVVLGIQTSAFSKELAIGFIEWLYDFGADAGITWSDDGIIK